MLENSFDNSWINVYFVRFVYQWCKARRQRKTSKHHMCQRILHHYFFAFKSTICFEFVIWKKQANTTSNTEFEIRSEKLRYGSFHAMQWAFSMLWKPFFVIQANMVSHQNPIKVISETQFLCQMRFFSCVTYCVLIIRYGLSVGKMWKWNLLDRRW